MPVVVRIKPAVLATKDASQITKTFYFKPANSAFTVAGNDQITVNNSVGDAWVAADSDMEIINRT